MTIVRFAVSSFLLLLPGLALRADDPAKATGVTVCNLGVLAPSGKVLFLPGTSGVEAIAVFNGKPLWEAKDTGLPLLATADYVVSQIQVKGKKNQVKLEVLDATTGERLRSSDVIEFPDWVSVTLDYGHRFRSAARLGKNKVLFVWEAYTFSDGGRPPPDPDPNAKRAAGAFRLDVKSGLVSPVKKLQPKEGELPDWTPGQTKHGGWVFRVEEKSPQPGFPHVLTPRTLIAEREDGKGSWKRPLVGQPYLPPRP
jgi:hypothetical protein